MDDEQDSNESSDDDLPDDQGLPFVIAASECIERVIDKTEWDRRLGVIKWRALRLKPREVEAGAASVVRARIGKDALRVRGRLIYKGFAGFGEASAARLSEQHSLRDSRDHNFLGHADLIYSEPPARVTAVPREPPDVDEDYEREVAFYESLVPLFLWVPDPDLDADPWQGREFGHCGA